MFILIGHWWKQVEKNPQTSSSWRVPSRLFWIRSAGLLCELHTDASLRQSCLALCEQTAVENWRNTVFFHLNKMNVVVTVWRCETELCVLLPSPNMFVCESHILADEPQLLSLSKRLCLCLASLSEIGTFQWGLSYWLVCALPLLWSGESTGMKTGTVRGHINAKNTTLIPLSFSLSHSDMAATALVVKQEVLIANNNLATWQQQCFWH